MRWTEMKERWPLFDFVDKGNGHWKAIISKSSSMSFQVPVKEHTIKELDHDHRRKEVCIEYETLYPNLYFYVGNNYTVGAIWVKRDGRDAEAIPMPYDDLQNLEILERVNAQVGEMLETGGFWCTLCGAPKPKEEYSFFYFASNYCQQCKEDHPDIYRRAMAEDYG